LGRYLIEVFKDFSEYKRKAKGLEVDLDEDNES